jgi:hypothetical protein
MNLLERLIGLLANLLVVSLVVGLFVRRRHRSSWFFTTYLLTVVAAESALSLWPAYFYTRRFWVARELVHELLKLGIAVELSVKTFGAFPGARATAQRTTFLVLMITFAAVVSAPVGTPDYRELAAALLPRVINGTVWLFTAIGGLILWYRLPVDRFHKAILIGFVPYLLIFTFAMHALATFGWQHREYMSYAHTVAYVVLLSYWNYEAWQQESVPPGRLTRTDKGEIQEEPTPKILSTRRRQAALDAIGLYL